MQSKAATVAEYLASLPEDRRAAIAAVRAVILENLDRDYEEGMAYGMIGYSVPLRVFPRGYHCAPPSRPQPLPFAGLASQKNYMSLYLMSCYGEDPRRDWFRKEWARTGKRLDMGGSCIRFKKLDDLALDVIARAIRETPARKYVLSYQKALAVIQSRKAVATKRPSKTPDTAKSAAAAKRKVAPRSAARAKAARNR